MIRTLACLVTLLATFVSGSALAHDPAPTPPAPKLTLSAESGQTATLLMEVPVGPGHSRSVRASISLELQAGGVRVEYLDPAGQGAFAVSGRLAAPAIELGSEYEISGEGTLTPRSTAVRVRVSVDSGSATVWGAQVARVESAIEEENFDDLSALRAAAEALGDELTDLPKVSADDHSATCDDPTHNHGAHGHSHSHGQGHNHGHDHSHGQDAAGSPNPLDDPAPRPLDRSERTELESLRLEVERLRRELESLRSAPKKKDPRQKTGEKSVYLADEAPESEMPGLDEATPVSHTTEALKIVTTLPILASIAQTIGGDAVTTVSLSPPGVDPHDVHMTPALTTTLKGAALFIESGMGLESWTSRAVTASGNPVIQPGESGHLYATTGVTPVEIPTAEEIAAGGHVHAAGNPHVWLSPLNVKVIASNIEARLARLQPESASDFARRSAEFQGEIDQRLFGPKLVEIIGARALERLHRADKLIPFLEKKKIKGTPLVESLGGWLARTRSFEKRRLITYHRTWSYMANCFDLEVVATIEEKPGIPPSPAHIASLTELARSSGISIVAAPPYYPRNRIESLAQRIGGTSLVLPTQPGEAKEATDALSLFDTILKQIESAQ